MEKNDKPTYKGEMKHHKMQNSMKQDKLDSKNKNKRCAENLYMEKKTT